MRISDWSSDVCSSDLDGGAGMALQGGLQVPARRGGLVLDQAGAGLEELAIGELRRAAAGLGGAAIPVGGLAVALAHAAAGLVLRGEQLGRGDVAAADRKSTRLNSSH